MSRQIVNTITCDRCGYSEETRGFWEVDLKNPLLGAWSKYWTGRLHWKVSQSQAKDLCPSCTNEMKRVKDGFSVDDHFLLKLYNATSLENMEAVRDHLNKSIRRRRSSERKAQG